jgi:TatA/E family protein of Tat protein translocase
MEIMGIGPMELILILIIALMVFGPEKLPEMGAKLGKGLRGMREATREFSREIEETRAALEAPIKEVTEPFNDVRQAAQTISNPGAALRNAVMGEINAADAAARVPSADGAENAASATETATSVDAVTPPTWTPPAAVSPDVDPAIADATAPADAPPSSDGLTTPLPYVPASVVSQPVADTDHQGYTADQFFPRPSEPEPESATTTSAALLEEPAPAPAVPVNGHDAAVADGVEYSDADFIPEAVDAPSSRAELVQPAVAEAASQPVVAEATEAVATEAVAIEPEAAPSAAAEPEAVLLPSASADPDNLDLPALPAPEE